MKTSLFCCCFQSCLACGCVFSSNVLSQDISMGNMNPFIGHFLKNMNFMCILYCRYAQVLTKYDRLQSKQEYECI